MIKIKTSIRKHLKKTVHFFLLMLVHAGQLLFIVSLKCAYDRKKIRNRTLVFLDEGKKRKINIKSIYLFGTQTRFFVIHHAGREIIFDRLPLGNSYYRISHRTVDNKFEVKKILMKYCILTPEGNLFRHPRLAYEYAEKIGYPVVIKPVDGSLSKDVTINIANQTELETAIFKIKNHEDKFLLEKFILGDNYRALVVDYQLIGCVMRYPAHVVGDGKNTIRKLINKKNKHPLRGDKEVFNTTLYKINIDQKLKAKIKSQGYDINSVLSKNKKIFLNDKINALSGVEIYDVTDKVHPKTQKLFIKVAKLFDSQLLGIDYITKNISKPWSKVKSAIIEINSVPYIDLHHFPLRGKPQNVSGHLWDMILK